MTCGFGPLRRIVALSVAITLAAAPVLWAQSPGPASPIPEPANRVLLSPSAFARLVQPPQADVALVHVADSRRPSLLRQATTAMAHEAQAAPTKAPSQKNWIARHKVAVLIGVGVFFGVVFLGCKLGDCSG
jgi:hypothetical protein